MFRKPGFWVVFVAVSLLCTAWAVRYFGEAFPLVTVDITMDRQAAIEAAGTLADARGWGPAEPRQAVEFSLDNELQSFVELDAGGQEAFSALLTSELASPYQWVVRRFREGETNETVVRFRPDGRPWGFAERIPEDEPGPSLDPDAARVLAERAAVGEWGVDLAGFELVEASQELKPGGRTDHVLVYERPDERLGEGRYRLQLTVSGDRFTGLAHFVKIPEAFSRRYQEMRAANEGIAAGAGFAVAILYLGGGCAFGLFLLLRERWVLWKPALGWALVIAGLQALVVLNQWPLLWMGYDTAVSSTTFALQQIAVALAQLVGMGAVLALSFMAAESLGRRAFPHHLQLWKTWSGEVAPTRAVLGQTVAGYLLVGVFFAYEVWLYLVAARHFEWWSPSSALTDPNVLANYLPWLTSIAVSLQAGFWEECLFRAVPLASAALLGRRFGRPWIWIAGAMVLQAVVFGAGHANYPAQPAYARLVELIVPALGFGGLYLAFGLLPAIVFHFAYDVVWFALPLFAADTPGIWTSRAIVILLTLVPLWIVLRSRRRSGEWREVPDAARNGAWAPPPPPPRPTIAEPAVTSGLSRRALGLAAALGLVGVAAWVLTTDFRADAPSLRTTDAEARAAARRQLAERQLELGAEWRELSSVQAPLGLEDRFVWTEGGPTAYHQLFGAYLPTPRRTVRYARFEGDVAARAEEYAAFVGPDGSVQRLVHALPEGRPGASLDEEAARTLALATIRGRYGLSADAIEPVSSEPSQLEARRDWSFVYRDPGAFPLAEGEARLVVRIAGDEVVESGRFVHVPEEWEREYRGRRGLTEIVQIVCAAALVLAFLAGAVLAVVRWSHGRFDRSAFLVFFAAAAVMGAVQLAIGFRPLSARFLTAQPWLLQAGILLIGGLIATTAVAAVTGLLVGLAHRWLPQQPAAARGAHLLAGLGLGAAVAGLGAAASSVLPSPLPDWPSYAGAADLLPALTAALSPIDSWLTASAFALLMAAAITALTRGWRRRRVGAAAVLVGIGLVVAGSQGIETLPLWALEGLVGGAALLALWALVLHRQPSLVPLVLATPAVLAAVRRAIVAPFPGAAAGSLVGAVAVLAVAAWWYGRLVRDSASGGRSRKVDGAGAELPRQGG